MKSFNGVLTIIAVLMGVSGLWGAYLTEPAERKDDLDELSRVTLTEMTNTRTGRTSRAAIVIVAAVNGLSPLMAALIVLLPFFAAGNSSDLTWAYYTAIGLALFPLFASGLFLGYISKGRMIMYGLKTVLAGIVSIAISFILGVEG